LTSREESTGSRTSRLRPPSKGSLRRIAATSRGTINTCPRPVATSSGPMPVPNGNPLATNGRGTSAEETRTDRRGMITHPPGANGPAAHSCTTTASAATATAATHAGIRRVNTQPTAAGTSLGMPTSTPATTTTILGEDKTIGLDIRDGRPAHLQIRLHRRHRILWWRRHLERRTRPTAASNRGLSQHHADLQVTTRHGEITNGVATVPLATIGAPTQAIHRAVTPGSTGIRRLLLDRTQLPAPTTQADTTLGIPTLPLERPPPLPLHHLIHRWCA